MKLLPGIAVFIVNLLLIYKSHRSVAYEVCSPTMDLVVILDYSGSIGTSNWRNYMIPFVSNMIQSLDIADNKIRLGLITFSTNAQNVYPLNKYKTPNINHKELLNNEVSRQNTLVPSGTTNTISALSMALNDLKDNNRPNVPMVTILITDGAPNSAIDSQMKLNNAANIIPYAVGVGGFSAQSCRVAAGCAANDTNCPRLFSSAWDKMKDELTKLIKDVCTKFAQDAKCSQWAPWSNCSSQCDAGTKSRSRIEPYTITAAVNGDDGTKGKSCLEQGPISENGTCNNGICAQNAKCSQWAQWSSSSATCGIGTRKRTRITPFTLTPAVTSWNNIKGLTCEEQMKSEETEEVVMNPCPIDAQVSQWSPFEECDQPCGEGKRSSTRTITVQAEYGGKTVEQQGLDLIRYESCINFPCGKCSSKWTKWTNCSTCGSNGLKVRYRSVHFDRGNEACTRITNQTETCNEPCPVTPEFDEPKSSSSAALAGGIIGVVGLVSAAGGAAYHFSKPQTATEVSSRDFIDSSGDADVQVEEVDEIVNVDASSDFWADEQ